MGLDAHLRSLHQSDHSRNLELGARLYSKEFPKLHEHLKGSTVIDIGGGESSQMAEFVEDAGAKRYINIDLRTHNNKYVSETTKIEYITGDAIDVLDDHQLLKSVRTSPDESCNFMINGLDGVSTQIDPEELASKLLFFMKAGDYVFGVSAQDIAEYLFKDTENFETVVYDSNGFPFFAFRLRGRDRFKDKKNAA